MASEQTKTAELSVIVQVADGRVIETGNEAGAKIAALVKCASLTVWLVVSVELNPILTSISI